MKEDLSLGGECIDEWMKTFSIAFLFYIVSVQLGAQARLIVHFAL